MVTSASIQFTTHASRVLQQVVELPEQPHGQPQNTSAPDKVVAMSVWASVGTEAHTDTATT